ncbi:hypothetical protein Trydic_g19072 [Trypoxylus dichotomus]
MLGRQTSHLPQAPPLSPVLSNIYVWELSKFHWINGLSSLKFTNDTAILAMGRNESVTITKLKKGIEAMKKYVETWSIKINAEKTELISFSRERHRNDSVVSRNHRLKIWAWNWMTN